MPLLTDFAVQVAGVMKHCDIVRLSMPVEDIFCEGIWIYCQ